MSLVYLVSGGLLLVIVSVDILWTTLWVQGGAGPLTSRLMSQMWKLMRKVIGHRQRLLTVSGPVILVTSLVVWLGLLWGGWTLVFAAGERALVDTRNTGPISWWGRLYFTGYSIFTLGNGDFSPLGGVWQFATVIATASGMFFVTLIVTYILSVLGAVTQKRAFASSVSGLGKQSDEILLTSWDGEDFQGLELQLSELSSELDTLTANHKAYPILHYFYSAQPKNAPAVGIVVLDEMLTILRFGIPEHDTIIVRSARSSVEDYLKTLRDAFIDPADQSPAHPELSPFREAGIPTVADEEFIDSVADLKKRRRQLLGLIESDVREWPNRDGG